MEWGWSQYNWLEFLPVLLHWFHVVSKIARILWPRALEKTKHWHVAEAEVNCIYVRVDLKQCFPYGFKENSLVIIQSFIANKSLKIKRSVFGKRKQKVVKTIGLQRGETKVCGKLCYSLDHLKINWNSNV